MNKLEKKILDFFPLGKYKNTLTNVAKIIGCSERVLYKYLDILEDKGYLTRRKETVSGGTTGDGKYITIVEKIKA